MKISVCQLNHLGLRPLTTTNFRMAKQQRHLQSSRFERTLQFNRRRIVRRTKIANLTGSKQLRVLNSADNRPGDSASQTSTTNPKILFESLGSSKSDFAKPVVSSEDSAASAQDSNLSLGIKGTVSFQRRWIIVGLCFVAFMLCNMDRVNMSISILPMAEQYGWDSQIKGIVQSSFFWGYLLTQVLGGIWADKFGGKRVLSFGVIWWSLATAMTPIAANLGLPVLLAARACMGIGEGVAMPAMNNLLAKWVPMKERSRSLALVYSGMFVGSILGLAVSPHMIQFMKWPSVFYIFGSLGVLWFGLWNQSAHSSPREDPLISQLEVECIEEDKPALSSEIKIPWRKLLTRTEVWAIIVCHFCHNWGTFILLTWMPTYYNQVLGLDLMKSGLFSVLPWITMAISANVGGWIADSLVPKLGVTTVRKLMQTIGFLGPAFFLTQLSKVDTVPMAVLCMMFSQGLDAFSQSGLYSNHQDIGPKYSGVLLGLSNTAGVLAGVFGTYVTGRILQTGSWDQVWGLAVMLQITGTVVWNLFSTGECIFD
eukprot:g8797.t1